MNDLTITVAGWAATHPKIHLGPTGTQMTTFRLASTSRYYDRDKGAWVDGQTEWFSVRAFRNAAVTVEKSVEKGQPLVVQGRLRTNQWESDSGPRTDLVIDAVALGHDLTRGAATFIRAIVDPTLGVPAETDEDQPEEDQMEPAEGLEIDLAEQPEDQETEAVLVRSA